MCKSLMFLFLVALLALAGCGGSAAPTNTPVPLAPSATPIPAGGNAPATPAAAAATTPAAAAPTDTPVAAAPTETVTVNAAPTMTPVVVEVVLITPPPAVTIVDAAPELPPRSTFDGTPGAAADSAVAVSVPVTISVALPEGSEGQFYKLDLSPYKGGSLVMNLSVPATAAGDVRMALLDGANGDEIDGRTVDRAKRDQLVEDVKAGVYLVKVSGESTGDKPYTLVLDFHPYANNADADSAFKAALVATAKSNISGPSDQHWYTVDMSAFPQGGELRLSLAVPPKANGEYRLRLLDEAGANELDGKSVPAGQKDELSVEMRAATNYKIVVQSAGGYDWSNPYVLTLNFVPHSAYATAKAALTVTPPVLLKIQVPAPGDVLYFSFPAAEGTTATAQVRIPNDGNSVRVSFADSSGQNEYNGRTFDPGQDDLLAVDLPNQGTYVLRVERSSGTATTTSPTQVELRVEKKQP